MGVDGVVVGVGVGVVVDVGVLVAVGVGIGVLVLGEIGVGTGVFVFDGVATEIDVLVLVVVGVEGAVVGDTTKTSAVAFEQDTPLQAITESTLGPALLNAVTRRSVVPVDGLPEGAFQDQLVTDPSVTVASQVTELPGRTVKGWHETLICGGATSLTVTTVEPLLHPPGPQTSRAIVLGPADANFVESDRPLPDEGDPPDAIHVRPVTDPSTVAVQVVVSPDLRLPGEHLKATIWGAETGVDD